MILQYEPILFDFFHHVLYTLQTIHHGIILLSDNEFHFHEECCEMIYKRLWDKLNPEELLVACLYTRRGGIDINPIRVNRLELLEQELVDINQFTRRTSKQ